MAGFVRGVGFVVVAVGVAAAGCSEPVVGRGELAPKAAGISLPPSPGVTTTAAAPVTPRPTASPTPSPTPSPAPRRRDPGAVARVADIRGGDLPAGWKPVPGSRTGSDSLSWVVVCARDAGVSPGSLSGAETPDFSPDGTVDTSQVGSATGLFPDDAAAGRFVALLRDRVFGRCVATEAQRTWTDTFAGAVPAFTPNRYRVATATEAAGIGTRAVRQGDSQRLTIQFLAIRTGPIVTVISTFWFGAADNRVVDRVGARIASRQRIA